MKIGIEQGPLRRCGASFEKQMERARRIGFEALDFSEFTLYDTEEVYKLTPAQFEKRMLSYAEAAKNNGIAINQTHGPWKYPRAPLPKEEIELQLERSLQSIEGTAMLGCSNIVFHALLPYTSHDMQYEDESIKINVGFLTKICEKADEMNVDVCLENLPMLRFSVGSVRRVISMVDVVGHKRLKICLDTGHCNIFEVKQSKAIREIGKDRLKVMHVHDNHGASDEHLFPFDGNIDWTDFAEGLKEIGYDGVLSLETGSHDTLPDELFDGYLTDLFNRAKYIEKMTR